MSELIVVAFTDEEKAGEVRKILFTMEKQYLLELEDAVVVVKNQEGKFSINQTYNLVASGAMGGVVYGGLWELLIGVLFFKPIIGMGCRWNSRSSHRGRIRMVKRHRHR